MRKQKTYKKRIYVSRYVPYTINDEHFEWDKAKAYINQKKWGYSFEKAAEALSAGHIHTYSHQKIDGEYRMVTLALAVGVDGFRTLLQIVTTIRVHPNKTDTTRIISAREANKKQKQAYRSQI